MKARLAQLRSADQTKSPWLFFVVTFSLTWLFWIPAAMISRGGLSALPLIVLGGVFGKLGPALVLAYVTYSPEEWRDYWRRAFDVRRIGLGW